MKTSEMTEKHAFLGSENMQMDLALLGYMAQRISVTLYLLDEPVDAALPLRYDAEEAHNSTHRIAVYRPQELGLNDPLDFVGFISSKQQPGNTEVVEEIQAMDKQLDDELVRTPGLLSYSSLELRGGCWCNLVLFNNPETKTHIKHSKTHAYAAYELAPRYYEWIRIHTGIMPEGLARNKLVVQKTRSYLFHGNHEKPTIREMMYTA